MSKNPVINALCAFGYIVLLVLVMGIGTRTMPKPDTLLAPLMAICVFTLSAAVMGYIFGYQPAQLYFDGKKKEGAKLFLQTVAYFGVATAVVLGLAFSGVLG